MFRLEKEMIPHIQEFFNNRFLNGYSIDEFNSGIGIADFVFSPKLNQRKYYFQNFEILYHTLSLFNRKNKKITQKHFYTRFPKNRIDSLIEKFTILDLIESNGTDEFVVKSKLTPSVHEFYAVEAKLKDWKSGFYQAKRYSNFAHKTYLAISAEFIHRVDHNLLKSHNIGLLSVSENTTNLLINPKKKKPSNELAYYFSGESFVQILSQCDNSITYQPHNWL